MAANDRHLFGPVSSRRFGRSLGVDLTPYKTCCQDCVFCQLGPTTAKTVTRKECVPTEEVIGELSRWSRSSGRVDHVTLSGSGEPTLHIRFGEVLDHIRSLGRAPSLLLTNGCLFWASEVRRAACRADVVKISLSAWDQASFERINRPHPDLRFDAVQEGLAVFRAEFSGRLLLEVFLVRGLNTAAEEVERIAEQAEALRPDRIQFNTVTRPPCSASATAATEREMKRLAPLFHPVAERLREPERHHGQLGTATTEAIVSMVRRRPSTPRQLAEAFGANTSEIVKQVAQLVQSGRVKIRSANDHAFIVDAGRKGSKRGETGHA
jgi:wyosine [tRNA(Phe)-imidazoG37] synthetase (radical SAM superfamily)